MISASNQAGGSLVAEVVRSTGIVHCRLIAGVGEAVMQGGGELLGCGHGRPACSAQRGRGGVGRVGIRWSPGRGPFLGVDAQ